MGNKVNKINYSMKNETSKKYCGKMWLFWMNDSWSIVIKVSDVFITQYFSTPQKDGVTVSLKVAEMAVFSFLFLPRSSLFPLSLPSCSSLSSFSLLLFPLSLSFSPLIYSLLFLFSLLSLSYLYLFYSVYFSLYPIPLFPSSLFSLSSLYLSSLSLTLFFLFFFSSSSREVNVLWLILYNSNNTASSTIL